MNQQIKKGLDVLGLNPVEQEKIDQLGWFLNEVLEKNKVMNLTAITDPEEAVKLHVLDSAALAKFIPTDAKTLIDVGTGAGFPGMPLKILKPTLEVTLMDALEKRLLWIEEKAEQLELENLFILHGRAEELGQNAECREVFDVATARAVADLSLLSEIVIPFVRVGGRFIAMKSTVCEEEIEKGETAIKVLGGEISEIYDYKIPETEIHHRLIVIEKIKPTPEKYPRRWAKMKKTPLSAT